MVMECQGFPKNKKDPCLLSVSAAAPECGPVLCFSLGPLSLLFSIASWPLAILTLFWIPECARLRPAWRLSAFRSPVIGVFFSAPSRCLAHSYISAQISLQQTFLSMYNAPYALLDAWGYISEEIRQRPNFCGSTFCLFLEFSPEPPPPILPGLIKSFSTWQMLSVFCLFNASSPALDCRFYKVRNYVSLIHHWIPSTSTLPNTLKGLSRYGQRNG